MATATEVLDLLADARSADGALDRGRAWAAALRGIVGLPAQEKRDLALLVAERAAPELVPRIRETGLELSSDQVETVLDLFRSLDAEDVEELRRTMTDPEAREAALRSTAQATAAAAVAAAGLDDDEELPPPPPHLLEAQPGDADGSPEDELEAADAALADAERRRREVEEQAERELAAAEAELAAVRTADEPEDIVEHLGEEAGDEVEVPPPHATEQAAPAPYEPVFRDRELPSATAPEPGAAAVAAADRRTAATGLVERLRTAGTDGRRLALLTASIDDVLTLESDQVTEVVRAIPDGWARRRAVERLLEHDAFLAREVPDAVRLLGRASDRTWVAATAVEARLLELDALDTLLEPRAAARLRRRYS